MKRRDIGILGEYLAGEFLQKNGYQLVATNYRCPEGEIDIIARHEDTLVFIEVRTRISRQYGTPEESITPAKMARLRSVAARYGQDHPDLPSAWRIDVVAIEMDKNGQVSRIEIIEDAVGEAGR